MSLEWYLLVVEIILVDTTLELVWCYSVSITIIIAITVTL
jgi:hypothetical protein